MTTPASTPKTWLTGDWHLGETRMDIMMRPFSGPAEQTAVLLERHNKVVRPEDTVIHVGDVISKSHDPAYRQSYIEEIASFNGRKILIRGNHDEPFSDHDFGLYREQPLFERIIGHGGGMELHVDVSKPEDVPPGCATAVLPLWATHYPTLAREGRFNLVGHIHSAWKFQLNSLNVGVDCHSFYPVALARVPFFFEAISKHYDQDVWAAYLDANANYRSERGKPGSYYPPKPQ